VVADYDGNGLADPAVYDRTTGLWAISFSSSGYKIMTCMFGGSGYLPATADYDGDGLADPRVYHEDTGIWELFLSTCGYQEKLSGQFGSPTCQPALE
jgi:hypothetical protein